MTVKSNENHPFVHPAPCLCPSCIRASDRASERESSSKRNDLSSDYGQHNAEIVRLTRENEVMRKALKEIAGLELGSRGAYAKFAHAQSVAQATIASLKDTVK